MSSVVIAGNTSGSITLQAPDIAGTTTLSLPATSGTIVTTASGTATAANAIANTGGWAVTPSGTTLYFSYNGTNVAKLDSSGNFTALANVTAYGTV